MVDSNWTVKLTNFVTEEVISDKLKHHEIRPYGLKESFRKKKHKSRDKDNKKDSDAKEDKDEDDEDDFDNMVDARSITDKSKALLAEYPTTKVAPFLCLKIVPFWVWKRATPSFFELF